MAERVLQTAGASLFLYLAFLTITLVGALIVLEGRGYFEELWTCNPRVSHLFPNSMSLQNTQSYDVGFPRVSCRIP